MKLYLPGGLLVLIGFFLAYQFVEPAPPGIVRMATGTPDGAYHRYAQLYADVLADHGIELELVESRGSLDNLAKLRAAEVEMAFVQGGVRSENDRTDLLALGAMFLEPFWVFSRHSALDELRQLKGQRVAIGRLGSGTRVLASRWLSANDVTSANSTFLDWGGRDAIDALADNQADAVIVVASPKAATVQTLLTTPDVWPMSFGRADAYAQRYRFADEVQLNQGAIDLADNIPKRDITLVAASAALVVSPDIHPAIVDLMMMVTQRLHRRGGLFERPGAFPSPDHIDFSLHENAARYFQRGPQFLMRYLPFGVANFIDRTAILLIPLFTLLLPMLRILPPALDWSIRTRVYRCYDELRAVEQAAKSAETDDDRQKLETRLDELEARVSNISVPRINTDLVYTLRLHIRLIRDQLRGNG